MASLCHRQRPKWYAKAEAEFLIEIRALTISKLATEAGKNIRTLQKSNPGTGLYYSLNLFLSLACTFNLSGVGCPPSIGARPRPEK